jgi:DNA-binding NtrC family response regulator
VLRALQENKITRVGDSKDVPVDVRVVAATNKDLLKEIDAGNFRLDLYHRLSVIIIHVPSLNQRRDDIALLAERFLADVAKDYNMPEKQFDPSALEALSQYNWTGNIRELRNVVERLAILGGNTITSDDVAQFTNPTLERSSSKKLIHDIESDSSLDYLIEGFQNLQEFKDYLEKEFIRSKLRAFSWNIAKTAEEIGMQRSHLYTKVEKYGLKRAE